MQEKTQSPHYKRMLYYGFMQGAAMFSGLRLDRTSYQKIALEQHYTICGIPYQRANIVGIINTDDEMGKPEEGFSAVKYEPYQREYSTLEVSLLDKKAEPNIHEFCSYMSLALHYPVTYVDHHRIKPEILKDIRLEKKK
jgi:hypothetical protein